VIIGFNNIVHWWICDAGLRIPQNVAFITLGTELQTREGREITGTMSMIAELGAAGIELLVSQIHLNARGIPDPVQTVLLEPRWHEGASLPDLAQPLAAGKTSKSRTREKPEYENSFPGQIRFER